MKWNDRVKARMADLGLTQDDLIDIFGVGTRGGVGHYLTGRREPSIAVLVPLADRLGMTLDQILRDDAPALSPLSQPQRLDSTMLAESIEALRRVWARRGLVFDPVAQPEMVVYAYELLAELGDEPTTAQLIDFGAKLAERDKAKAGVESGREEDRQSSGANRARSKGSTRTAP